MGRKIAVVSGKGGVGKTTIACGLALALVKKGSNVCLIDLDVGLNNLDLLLGVENKVVYDISDVLKGKCRISQALINDSAFEGLYLLPSARFEEQSFDAKEVKLLSDKLVSMFDYVIIDAPAGINNNLELALASANEVLVVVTPHVASLRDADKVISIVKGKEFENVQLVINRIRGDMVVRKEMLSHSQIQKLLKLPLLGVIPESDDINIYSSFKFERISKSGSVDAFMVLAHNIKSDKKILFDYTSKYKGLLGVIRRNLKRSI